MAFPGDPADSAGPPSTPAAVIELTTGAIAAGGGCVARAADGRVVFVRHALPGERVMAEVTAVRSVVPPGRCRGGARGVARPGGAPVSPRRSGPMRRMRLAARLTAGPAPPEGVRSYPSSSAGWPASSGRWRWSRSTGSPDGLGWRTRVQVRRRRLRADRAAQAPLPRHRTGGSLPAGHRGGQPGGRGRVPVERGPPRRGHRFP